MVFIINTETDRIRQFMEKNYSDIGNESLNAFFNLQIDYYMPHIFFKYAVDYLDPITLKKLLPKFEDVRKYAEHVFDETEEFTLKIATQIASNLGYTAEQILNCTKAEIISYFKNKI